MAGIPHEMEPPEIMKFPTLRQASGAFSLLELLAVIAITVTLMVVSGPSLGALNTAGGVNRAAADLAGVLELARSHAMARQTHVRVAFADLAPGGRIPEGGVLLLVLASADGTVSSSDMADSGRWLATGRPLVLRNFEIRDLLNAATPDTSGDALPSGSDLSVVSLVREVAGHGVVTFDAFLQFDPGGQAAVKSGVPARHVKIALDRRGPQGGRNPVIVRLAGNNGAVNILRADQIAP